jgi:hypothetical protein
MAEYLTWTNVLPIVIGGYVLSYIYQHAEYEWPWTKGFLTAGVLWGAWRFVQHVLLNQ